MKFKVGDKVEVLPPIRENEYCTEALLMIGDCYYISDADGDCYALKDTYGEYFWFNEENLKLIEPAPKSIKTHLQVGDRVKVLYSRKKKYQDIIGLEGYIKKIKYNFQYPEYIDTIRVEIPGLPLNDTDDGCWLFEREKDLQLEKRAETIDINYDGLKYVAGNGHNFELDNDSPTLINKFLNRKENSEMELLNIYEERKNKQINETFDSKAKELREKDTLYKKVLELKKEYEERLKKEHTASDMVNVDIFNLTNYKPSEELNNEFNKISEERENAFRELDKLLDEVRAQLVICETYEQKINLFKTYGILTKEGKLSI